MQQSTILLLLITNVKNNIGIVPGKTFEYLRSRKPLLVFGSVDGEVAKIVNKTKSGRVIEYEDFNEICNYLENILINGHSQIDTPLSRINMYDRKNLTKRLAELFAAII